jgi:tetratricopeptide (TPR) repeat protein
LQAAKTCIEIYEALLAESEHPAGIDDFIPPSSHSSRATESRQSCAERYHTLIHHAYALRERYSHTGHEPDLDAAIVQSQAALATCGAESVLCPTVLVIHASLLERDSGRTDHSDSLNVAESMCRQALALCTTACSLTPTAYHTLGWIMYRLYERFGTPAYLDDALNFQRRALNLESASDSTEDHLYLRALAVSTLYRHTRSGNPQDIDDAISFLEQALELCPVMHINRILIAQSMINAVHRKYICSGRVEELNKGIDLGRQLMNAPNLPRSERRLVLLNGLANLLSARYEYALSSDCDLEESVNLQREIVQYFSPSSMSRWVCAGNLINGLRCRFMRRGELRDLEESIELCRHAIDGFPEGHPERPKIFSSLGKNLCNRFHETLNATDLDEALTSDRYAMTAMSPSHLSYWDVSLTTISHLCIRFEVFQAVDDLDKAILLSEDLLKTIPDSHIDQDSMVLHLAKALLLRGAHLSVREDIDRAIYELVPFRRRLAQSANAPQVSRTLAASYLVRFRLNKNSCDATHALDITNDLLDLVRPNHYERFQCLVHAAELYSELGTPFHDIAIALKHIAEAMQNNCRDVRSKIQGAKTFLDIVKTQYQYVWPTASPAISAQLHDVYISIISILPRVAFFGLHLRSRLQSLAIGQSIALDGASHALNISLPERALEILEQGRSIFWSHTLRLRSPFDNVPDEFHDRLMYLARQLENSNDILPNTRDPQTIDKEAALRRQQSEEFNSLADRIRCLPGMERFLLNDEYATLASAADRGSVVVLVSSALGCHAIVVKSADEIYSIPLESMTKSWLEESGNVWRTGVTRARSAACNDRKMVKMGKTSRSMSTMTEAILEHLWTYVVYPVLSKLCLEVRYFH